MAQGRQNQGRRSGSRARKRPALDEPDSDLDADVWGASEDEAIQPEEQNEQEETAEEKRLRLGATDSVVRAPVRGVLAARCQANRTIRL